ncbi:hypothetical protein ACVC7V_14410 [Hydrogenophaga sp. A37]|nr:hypothetical protein B0E41_23465 [Hydrogenophaga sp. A37]
MRADVWIGLVDDLGYVCTLPREHADCADRLEHVRRTLAALMPIESYWAFPGGRVFGELCTWVERGELARAHQAARRIHRMLAAQTYRHETSALESEGELPSQIESDSERQAQLSRPYFEVLIVDEMTPSEENALHRRVQSKRSPGFRIFNDAALARAAQATAARTAVALSSRAALPTEADQQRVSIPTVQVV